MACVDPSMPLDLMVYLGQSDFWGMPMKFCVSFPLVYHFMGAIRHTVRRTLFILKKSSSDGTPFCAVQYWDVTAAGLNNARVASSSAALMGAATVVSGAITML